VVQCRAREGSEGSHWGKKRTLGGKKDAGQNGLSEGYGCQSPNKETYRMAKTAGECVNRVVLVGSEKAQKGFKGTE